MECFLQYLDDLDDLYGVVGLVWEKLRRAVLGLFTLTVLLAGAAGGVALALVHPPIALATGTVLFVILLYRSVTALDGSLTPATGV